MKISAGAFPPGYFSSPRPSLRVRTAHETPQVPLPGASTAVKSGPLKVHPPAPPHTEVFNLLR